MHVGTYECQVTNSGPLRRYFFFGGVVTRVFPRTRRSQREAKSAKSRNQDPYDAMMPPPDLLASARGLKLLLYEALSYACMRTYTTSAGGLKLLVYEALSTGVWVLKQKTDVHPD
jgi:hypothetical protein